MIVPCDTVDVDAPSPHKTSSPCPSRWRSWLGDRCVSESLSAELEYEEKKDGESAPSDYTVTGRDSS